MRTVLLLATVVGFLLTAYGLIQAYRGALRQVGVSEERLNESKRLRAEWRAAMKALGPEKTRAEADEVNARYAAMFEARGLLAPSYDNAPFQAAYEARHALRQAVEGARANLLWAGLGLVISTVASACSLYI
jgi:hypothetical protein